MANHIKWVNNLSDDSTLTFNFSQLVKASVLTVRDVGSWWIAIPCAGIYMKSFIRGRKAMLTMIRKCKYKEILQKVIIKHDIINIDLVSFPETVFLFQIERIVSMIFVKACLIRSKTTDMNGYKLVFLHLYDPKSNLLLNLIIIILK